MAICAPLLKMNTALLLLSLLFIQPVIGAEKADGKQPNILIAISDDQSWPDASVYGSPFVHTPNMDALAESGILFDNAYAASPGCSPSRASFLTGQHHWSIGPAGTHASSFPVYYATLADILLEADYKVGFTGKGWFPGDWVGGGRKMNPAGVEYNDILYPSASETAHIGNFQGEPLSNIDYASNFDAFLKERKEGEPFFFWYGSHEPHLPYAEKPVDEERQKQVRVPAYLPDTEAVRSTLVEYADEIQHFDTHLGRIITSLKEAGELENTLIIVTADNGNPLPGAKATGHDAGIHVPLVIHWGNHISHARTIKAPVGFVDLSATIIDAAGLEIPADFSGESLMETLQNPDRTLDYQRAVFSGRERHSCSRYKNLSYPVRTVRSGDFLLVWNMKPERFAAGAPQKYEKDGRLGAMHMAYHDVDDSVVKREFLVRRTESPVAELFDRCFGQRPEWQLFDISKDPATLIDLADQPPYADTLAALQQMLKNELVRTKDPRVLGYGDVWEDYPRLRGPMRFFPAPNN